MRLLLHIGSTKTGSSALQQTLHRERDALRETGAFYPDQGVAASAHHLLFAAIHPGAWNLHAGTLPGDRAAYFKETSARICEEMAGTDCTTMVLSSEYCWGCFKPDVYDAVREAFSGFSIEIVAFVRRPDHWLVSSYLQAVKSGEPDDFETWSRRMIDNKRSSFYFYDVIDGWRSGVGAKTVHVLVYEGQMKRNVFSAFCGATGIEGIDPAIQPAKVNPSPNTEGLRRLLEINRSDLDSDDKKSQRAAIMREHKAYSGKQTFVDGATRRRILQAAVPSNRSIRDAFRPDLTHLFREPWPPLSADGPAPREKASSDGRSPPPVPGS